MTNTVEPRILEKIKKCLALSQSPEPHEAAAAMRQAQKLMQLHGVAALDLARSDLAEASVKSKASVSRMKDWELKLVNLTARAFGCRIMWTKNRSWKRNFGEDVFGSYTLIGLKGQVELAQYTCEVLLRKLVKARAKHVSGISSWATRGEKVNSGDNFCHGWIDKIAVTVHEFALTDETKRLLDEEVKAQADGRKPVKAQERGDGGDGYRAGVNAADGESLHKPINDRKPTLRLS